MPTANAHAAAMRHLARRCPTMKKLIARIGPCTLTPRADDPFTLIVRCVISQQISGKAAASISAKLTEAVGGPPIAVKKLAQFTDEQFQACGVSGPKRRTLRAVCEFVQANRRFLPGIADRSDDLLREQLVSIKGIGPWTVDMILMFGISRPDVLPVGDYGLKVGVQKLFGLKELPKPTELETIAEPWRPHRSIATWYVWRSLGPVPQSE
ncbi:MAG TPA: DNA-3-methyladenine glycosylase [Urbifossiella sp.]|nr:DNA-3-methyladenine glycosylase [Urbifossiella sp.]